MRGSFLLTPILGDKANCAIQKSKLQAVLLIKRNILLTSLSWLLIDLHLEIFTQSKLNLNEVIIKDTLIACFVANL